MEIMAIFFIRFIYIMIVYLFIRFLYFTACAKQWNRMQQLYINTKTAFLPKDSPMITDITTKVYTIRFSWKFFWYLLRFPQTAKNVDIPYGRNFLWHDIIETWNDIYNPPK